MTKHINKSASRQSLLLKRVEIFVGACQERPPKSTLTNHLNVRRLATMVLSDFWKRLGLVIRAMSGPKNKKLSIVNFI